MQVIYHDDGNGCGEVVAVIAQPGYGIMDILEFVRDLNRFIKVSDEALKNRIAVVVSGGVVAEVISDRPQDLVVVDMDQDGDYPSEDKELFLYEGQLCRRAYYADFIAPGKPDELFNHFGAQV